MLGRVPDLIGSRFIDSLPQEERENRFRVVLDNIGGGVVPIGMDGQVTTITQMDNPNRKGGTHDCWNPKIN